MTTSSFYNNIVFIVCAIVGNPAMAEGDYLLWPNGDEKGIVQTKEQIIAQENGSKEHKDYPYPADSGNVAAPPLWKDAFPWDKRTFRIKDYYMRFKSGWLEVYGMNGKRLLGCIAIYGSSHDIMQAWWLHGMIDMATATMSRRMDMEMVKSLQFDREGDELLCTTKGVRLLAYAKGHYFFYELDPENTLERPVTMQETREMMETFARVQQGELQVEEAGEALKQAKNEESRRALRNTTIEIDRAVTYGLRSSVPFLRCGSSVRLREALNIPEEPMVNTIPNINAGVACGDIVDKLATGKLKVMETSGAEDGFKATLGSRSERIHYTIVHQFNRNLAINTALRFRYNDEMLDRWDHKRLSDQEIIDRSLINPGWVGDFDIATKARLGRDGAVVFGSEKSAIYFTRGNTAVSIVSENPYFNVLPMAQMVDEELKKKLNIPPAKEPAKQPPFPQQRKP